MEQKTYKDYLNMNMVDYSNNELEFILGQMQSEYEDYVQAWAKDAAKFATGDFDPYSFFGERKVKKLNKKYVDQLSDIDLIIHDIARELDRRDAINEGKQYLGQGKREAALDADDFIEQESIKTESLRSKSTKDDEI